MDSRADFIACEDCVMPCEASQVIAGVCVFCHSNVLYV